MSNYVPLRNQPFLVVYTLLRPAKGVRTEEKDWIMVTGNWSLFERVEIVDRVKKRHLTDASVIVNCINGQIVKSRFAKPDLEVSEHYLGKYMKECKAGIDVWIRRFGSQFINAEAAREAMIQAGLDLGLNDADGNAIPGAVMPEDGPAPARVEDDAEGVAPAGEDAA